MILIAFQVNCQIATQTILESSQKITGETGFYYSFAKGDQITIKVELTKGRNIKEVAIVEYPSNTIFQTFKTNNFQKTIKVKNDGIYFFKFKRGGIAQKIANIKIERTPSDISTVDFNTTVGWKVRYDSIYTTKYRRKLVTSDTLAIDLVDRKIRVHSTTHLNDSNSTSFIFEIPQLISQELFESEVVAWAYWLGVGEEGVLGYENETKAFLQDNIRTIANLTHPLAGFLFGLYTFHYDPPKGDDINFQITATNQEERGFVPPTLVAKGNDIIAFERVLNPIHGRHSVIFENDNVWNGVNVHFRVSAMLVERKYVLEPFEELTVQEYRYPVLQN